MKTLAEFEHGDSYSVKWEFDGVQHRITYGNHVFEETDNIKASREYGECVRHALSCAGVFNVENYS